MDEISRRKAEFARKVEDGRKVEAFTSMPEYNWYVDFVLKPTIKNETSKIMNGEYPSNKEDWIARGFVMGLKLMVDGPQAFVKGGYEAKKQAKSYQEYLDAGD